MHLGVREGSGEKCTLLNFPGPTPTFTGFEALRTSEPFPDEA